MSLTIERTCWNAYYLRGSGGECLLTATDVCALLTRARADGILKASDERAVRPSSEQRTASESQPVSDSGSH